MSPHSSEALRLEDAAARRLAQAEFTRPLVLEAGAGTGKTSVLVARIAVWALGPGWERARDRLAQATPSSGLERGPDPDRIAAEVFRRVAAITFTEAAAAEMARRTGEVLAEIEAGRQPVGVDEAALPASESERRERGRALLGALDHLQARTIHAFCRRLLSAHPFEARLHPGFGIDADEQVHADVVREVVESAMRDAYPQPDHPLTRLAEGGIGPGQIEEALSALAAEAVPAAQLERDAFAPEAVQALCAAVEGRCEGLLALGGGRFEDGRRTGKAQEVMAAVARLREAARAARAEGQPPESPRWGVAFDDRLVAKLRQWSRDEFSQGEAACLGSDALQFGERARDLQLTIDHLGQLDPAALDLVRRALAPLLGEVEQSLRWRGVVGYAALLRLARDLLRDHPEVCAHERRGLEQLLVDEFQDTDDLQCDLVRRLALEGPERERPGLFLVGDPKQSIYGWRNADLDAYDRFVSEVLRAGGSRHHLSVNFRSLPAVLDEVERVVAPIMRPRRGLQPAFQPLVACEARAAAAPFETGRSASVEHWISWEGQAEVGEPTLPRAGAAAQLEAVALANDLLALHAVGTPWSDAALLFRGSSDVDVYLRALRNAGIPYTVDRDRSFYQHREIIEAAALVRCILDPNDHLALVTWLRSAAVGVPDAALLPLWRRELPRFASELRGDDGEAPARLAALVAVAAADLPDDVPGLDRISGWPRNLLHALSALAALRDSFERDAADVFVEKLRALTLLEVGEASRFLGGFRVGNLDRFFRELAEGLERGADPQALLRRLRAGVSARREDREGRPAELPGDAVRVLTMHKAKGLDFEHVYLVQLHQETGAGGAPRPAAEIDGRHGLEYRIFGLPTPGFGEVQIERARVEAAERVRTLYVAMTRARTRLVLVGKRRRSPRCRLPEHARSHADLLDFRRGETPALTETFTRLAAEGGRALDAGGARWVFPALDDTPPPAAREPEAGAFVTGSEVAAGAAALRERATRAASRMARPFVTAASADSGAAHHEREAGRRSQAAGDRREPAPSPARAREAGALAGAARAREVAALAGTAIHRVLEDFDGRAEVGAEVARQSLRLSQILGAEDAGGAGSEALARARGLLDRIAEGALLGRLRALGDRIVARELPVLLLPPPDLAEGEVGDAGPVACVSGSIDLVYRDPEDDRFVVADYKTDAVDAEALADRAGAYAAQGVAYCGALRDALGLDYTPRFELWFLAADRVVEA